MNVVAIIPARYASQRLPGKPLLKETGKFLIQHTYEQVKKAKGIAKIIIATDDKRIFAACNSFNADVVMTSKRHKSGTDRIAEVARKIDADVFLNIQADEPEISPHSIETLIKLSKNRNVEMATLASSCSESEMHNPNVVKVTVDKNWNALYFSRSSIPFKRNSNDKHHYGLKHLGIYAYKKKILLKIASLKPSPLEMIEKLEQLRALENGIKIKVGLVKSGTTGIDTPEDYRKFVERCKKMEVEL